jgi:hypothetical protein
LTGYKDATHTHHTHAHTLARPIHTKLNERSRPLRGTRNTTERTHVCPIPGKILGTKDKPWMGALLAQWPMGLFGSAFFLTSFSENLSVKRIWLSKEFKYHTDYMWRNMKWSKGFRTRKRRIIPTIVMTRSILCPC